MKPVTIATQLFAITLLPHLANAQAIGFDDPFKNYLERSQGIALGAGDANETNEAIQTITPWPPHVSNRRIRVEGRHGVDAIERMYRIPDPFIQQSGGAAGSGGPGTAGSQSGTSGSGSAAVPMQPVTGGF